MNERTDVGWWLNSVDSRIPASARRRFANGIFSGIVSRRSQSLAARIGRAEPSGDRQERQHLLDQRRRLSNGRPADADRVRLQGRTTTCCSTGRRNTIYDPPGINISGPVYTTPGMADLLRRSRVARTAVRQRRMERHQTVASARSGARQRDGGKRDRHRLDSSGGQPARPLPDGVVDRRRRARSTSTSTTTTRRPTIRIRRWVCSPRSSRQQLFAERRRLAPGTYYVAIRPSGTTGSFQLLDATYKVNAPATVTVTSPSEEGSADDFANDVPEQRVGHDQCVGHRQP